MAQLLAMLFPNKTMKSLSPTIRDSFSQSKVCLEFRSACSYIAIINNKRRRELQIMYEDYQQTAYNHIIIAVSYLRLHSTYTKWPKFIFSRRESNYGCDWKRWSLEQGILIRVFFGSLILTFKNVKDLRVLGVIQGFVGDFEEWKARSWRIRFGCGETSFR